MLSQLPTRVTGSEPGPAGHSSLSGIAQNKVQGWQRGLPEGKRGEVNNVPSRASTGLGAEDRKEIPFYFKGQRRRQRLLPLPPTVFFSF